VGVQKRTAVTALSHADWACAITRATRRSKMFCNMGDDGCGDYEWGYIVAWLGDLFGF
jgi:hypothetical protein